MKAKLSRLIKTNEPKQTAVTPDDVEQAKWRARGGEILTFEQEWCVCLKQIYPLDETYHDFTFGSAKASLAT
ncbi:hypothetical protein ACSV5T_10470, partial [Veillonella sp. ZSJB6]|uniref:hypothetical protein n=1 Tax=Veillonella sp. ZSJB6 TaxID=3451359 RepID=UPI003EE6E5D9